MGDRHDVATQCFLFFGCAEVSAPHTVGDEFHTRRLQRVLDRVQLAGGDARDTIFGFEAPHRGDGDMSLSRELPLVEAKESASGSDLFRF